MRKSSIFPLTALGLLAIALILWRASYGFLSIAQTFSGSDSPIRGIAFSPNSRFLLLEDYDGNISVHDIALNKELWRCELGVQSVENLKFSDDGTHVLAWVKKGIRITASSFVHGQLKQGRNLKEAERK